jgi:hypothetical protein
MTPENFAFWLQGYFELLPNAAVLNADQVKTIREHLELVFEHVTSYGNEPKKYARAPVPEKERDEFKRAIPIYMPKLPERT